MNNAGTKKKIPSSLNQYLIIRSDTKIRKKRNRSILIPYNRSISTDPSPFLQRNPDFPVYSTIQRRSRAPADKSTEQLVYPIDFYIFSIGPSCSILDACPDNGQERGEGRRRRGEGWKKRGEGTRKKVAHAHGSHDAGSDRSLPYPSAIDIRSWKIIGN